ncbi:16S rRNA (adenine(1518)-N(6)/adenine(1519)-N(6))-dimethyltransferase RsmA [Pseudoclostridium thermosuccinogenes]|uniref:16S rRNA (adenine(1518)-N(6)/adenine(1519)-N(6))- dimethyltransferase RsmA n=1 Tax=Clostridium thermosuccinogenes TaxID=84032 RepID=UPI002FD99E03
MSTTKEIIIKYNIRMTKSLGQNFLTDENIVRRIVDTAEVNKDDLVVEIGPGIGSMTRELCARAGKVVAVEIDKHLMPALTDNLKDFDNIDIINGDILKVDIRKDILEKYVATGAFKPGCFKVVANLPYYITTPIIMKLLEDEYGINLMVFMVQKEVADRMVAAPGGKDYGSLSVAVQYYSMAEKVFDVPPHCFIPQPDVYSSVVRLRVHEDPPVKVNDRAAFFKTVKAAFGQRRKTLLNALYNSGYFAKDKEQIREILKSKGLDENQRGETLTIEQFADLSNALEKNRHTN